MNPEIEKLFNHPESVSHLQAGLPYAFEVAEAEAQRIQMGSNRKTKAQAGQEVGIYRERVILGYLISQLGEITVRMPQAGESMIDARVGDTPLEIKTVTKNGEVTAKWTADNASVERTMDEFQFNADLWLVRIWWEQDKKSIFYIPMEVLRDKALEFPHFLASSTNTNNRGIKLRRAFIAAAESDGRTRSVAINWLRSGEQLPKSIARYVKYWTDGDFPRLKEG